MMLLRRKLTSRGINISYDRAQQSVITAADCCFVLIKTHSWKLLHNKSDLFIFKQLFAEVEVNIHH